MSEKRSVKPREFFSKHPVFRYEEFLAAHSDSGSRSRLTSESVLKQHVAAGNLLHIRRGLYARVATGVSAEDMQVDPYLLAGKLAEDAVVAYHAALQFHGRVYSLWHRFHLLSHARLRPFVFRGAEFVPVQVPARIRSLPEMGGGILEVPHAGGRVRVTTLERSLVDVLDAPRRCGGWEETWRSLEMIDYFDLDAVLVQVQRLGSPLTAARVGFFLEENRERLMVEDEPLDALQKLAPTEPRYIDARRDSGKLVPRWNLIVPGGLRFRSWSG